MQIIPRNKGYDVTYKWETHHFDTLQEVLDFMKVTYGKEVNI